MQHEHLAKYWLSNGGKEMLRAAERQCCAVQFQQDCQTLSEPTVAGLRTEPLSIVVTSLQQTHNRAV